MGTSINAEAVRGGSPPVRDQQGESTASAPDRVLSVLAGSTLALMGLRRRGAAGAALATAGGMLIYYGGTGGGPARTLLDSLASRVPGARALHRPQHVHVDRSFTILRPRDELYAFWRDVTQLPRIMRHLERVEPVTEMRSHWVAKAPAGMSVEWDAVITEDRPGERIAWESVEPAEIPNHGTVRFADAPGGRGTEIHVTLDYEPPGGKAGDLLAHLFGKSPAQEVRDDLRGFKAMMEAGEIATTEGQSHGDRGLAPHLSFV